MTQRPDSVHIEGIGKFEKGEFVENVYRIQTAQDTVKFIRAYSTKRSNKEQIALNSTTKFA